MKTNWKFIKNYSITFTLTFILWMYFSSCNGASTEDLTKLTPPPGTTPGPAPTPLPGTNDGIATVSDFYVGVSQTTNSRAHVRTSTGFGTNCAVSSTAVASNDLICYIDMLEGDVWYQNLELLYNVPENMCRYFRRQTNWFYNEGVGVGPGYTRFEYNSSIVRDGVDGPIIGGAYSASGTCFIGSASGTEVAVDCASGTTEVRFDYNPVTSENSRVCLYDQSSVSTKHNCCFGNTSDVVINHVSDPSNSFLSAYDTVTTTNKNWGGNMRQCLGGAGRTNWSYYDEITGLPISFVEYAYDGTKGTYIVTSAKEAIVPSTVTSIHSANFYTGALHSHTGFVSATGSTKPYFVEPLDDADGSPIATANDNYTFECLDEAFEVKHRLRVYVREWDTLADYLTYLSTSGTTSVPDRGVDTEPDTNCEGVYGFCNDFVDIDDWVNVAIFGVLNPGYGGYPLATVPNATNIQNRRNYFPNMVYK